MSEREKIAARIRALLAKTTENGCTEDEAVAAAAKASEMLQKYNLTIDEVQLRENPFTRAKEQVSENFIGERLWKVAAAISHLVGTRYWTSQTAVRPVEITFFGFDHEVEISKYLLQICIRAMNDAYERFMCRHGLLTWPAKRRRLIPFLDGMRDALAHRIRALKKPEPTGTGLVVLRADLIDAAMADEGIKLSERATRKSRSLDGEYRDGVLAGEAVSLNPGIHGASGGERRIRG